MNQPLRADQQSPISAEQSGNLMFGVVGGLAGAAAGAAAWAIVTVLTGFQIGWMAIGVGFLVGLGVRYLGKGSGPVYGGVGAVLSLVGCVAGNFLAMVGFAAKSEGAPFFSLLSQVDPSLAMSAMIDAAGPMDLLFYAIAVYEGYKLSTVSPQAAS